MAAAAPAAACGGKARLGFGETPSALARRCGISAETLRKANPGISDRDFQAGTILVVPRPALPSAMRRVHGNEAIAPLPQPPRGRGPAVLIPRLERLRPPGVAVSPMRP